MCSNGGGSSAGGAEPARSCFRSPERSPSTGTSATADEGGCPSKPCPRCAGSGARSSKARFARPSAEPWAPRAASTILPVGDTNDAYLAREARARKKIDQQLKEAGWEVQSHKDANVAAGPGVAIREFVLEKGHGRVDYLLFVSGQPAGVIEAKPEGTTLVEVEHQAGRYVDGLPDWIKAPVYPLPFIYESTGAETRFTNGYDPDARSRRVFSFHRPETLAEWSRQILEPGAAHLSYPSDNRQGSNHRGAYVWARAMASSAMATIWSSSVAA